MNGREREGGRSAWHVGRALRLVELVTFTPMSAAEIAEALDANHRTTRRVVERLRILGWLVARGGYRRRYEPTLRIAALAAQVIDRSDLAQRARPHVAALHERTGLTAHMVVPSYDSVVCVCHAASGADERPHLREVVPAHCTAGGKALLAYREAWAASVLSTKLERHTLDTLTVPRILAANLERVRDHGHAVEDGEFQEGVRAVAVPVFSGTEVVAALSVSGRGLSVSKVVPHVARTAQALGLDLARDDAS